MFLTKASVAPILLIVCIGVAGALPGGTGETKEKSVQSDTPAAADAPQGRFLEPVLFGVKTKRFTIGTGGVGTFFRAWRNCIDEGKSLATTDTEEEQTVLAGLIEGHDTNYWIGATSLGSPSGALTWVTTDLEVKTAPNFNVLGTDFCVSMAPSGAWQANSCSDPDVVFPYLCEEYF